MLLSAPASILLHLHHVIRRTKIHRLLLVLLVKLTSSHLDLRGGRQRSYCQHLLSQIDWWRLELSEQLFGLLAALLLPRLLVLSSIVLVRVCIRSVV